jgi:twinkle protein
MINAVDLKNRLHGQIESVLNHLFPDGKREGKDWVVGDLSGVAGASLKVCMTGARIGIWNDFSSDDKGGDILDLWMRTRDLSFKEMFDEAARFVGISNVEPIRKKEKPLTPEVPRLPMRGSRVHEYCKGRGISDTTLIKYRVRTIERHGDPDWIAWHIHDFEDDRLLTVKAVAIDLNEKGKKQFWSTPPYHTLMGWWTVKPSDRAICITEGEFDMLSLDQMDPGCPVLSMPSGASNLEWIENDYDRLNMFERIYVCTDTDEAGEKAALQIANRLGLARTYRMKIPDLAGCKDANDILVRADQLEPEEIDASYWLNKAETYAPETIREAKSLVPGMLRLLERSQKEEKITFLFPTINFNIRPGETTILSGYPSGGKSNLLYQIILHELEMGERVLIGSYEINSEEMAFEMARMKHGRHLDPAHIEEVAEWLNDKCYFLTPDDPVSIPDLWRDMDYAAARYGVTRFAFDSLHFIVPKDEYVEQDTFVKKLHRKTKTMDVASILICHASVKKIGIDRIPGMAEVEGSGGLCRPVDNGVAMWRNHAKKVAIDEALGPDGCTKELAREIMDMHDSVFSIWKQRGNGVERNYRLWFNPDTKLFRTTLNDPIEQKPGQEEIF